MINEDARQRTVIVIGHTNPDTDSICSAIAYAELKNRMENAQELVEEAFETDTADGSVFLEGVISRKKQLIPPIVNTLRKM